MKKSTENSLSMFETVRAICNANIATINSNIGLANTFNRYLVILDEFEILAKQQILNRKGITMDKKQNRESMALKAEATSGIIKAHFDSVSNNDIFQSVNVNLTRLRTMRDQLFIAHLHTIITILTDHQPDLASFGVDAAYIAAFNDATVLYTNIATQPTIARNAKSTFTRLLAEKETALRVFLKNELDSAMLVVKQTHWAFYLTYRNARKIIDSGVRHEDKTNGIITGVVKEDITNEVIQNALVQIIGTETTVLTNELGEFTIIDIPQQTYTLKVSVGNYDIKMVEDVVVTADNITELEIKLTPTT